MAGGRSGCGDLWEPALRAPAQLGSLSPPLLTLIMNVALRGTRSLRDVGRAEKRRNNTHNSVAASAPAPGPFCSSRACACLRAFALAPGLRTQPPAGLWDSRRPHALQLSLHPPQPGPLVGSGLIVFGVCSRNQLAGSFLGSPACLPGLECALRGSTSGTKVVLSNRESRVTGSHHQTGHSEPLSVFSEGFF